MDKIRLKVLGLSYSMSQAGAYALILADEQDMHRIPIVIGMPEAQSIAIQLEKMPDSAAVDSRPDQEVGGCVASHFKRSFYLSSGFRNFLFGIAI